MPYSFIIDLNKCTGCQACRLACSIENELEPDQSWRKVDTFNPHRFPKVPLFHLSLACNHCGEAPCMRQCPAGAYSRDEETGAILIDPKRCIGCRYCAWVCPYGAPLFNDESGVMEKCTLCHERVKEGRKPACADLCPTGALQFENLHDGELTHDVEGFPKADIHPSVKIIPLRGEREVPECTSPSGAEAKDAFQERPALGLSLRQEWPLVAFTLIAAVLVAAAAAQADAVARVEPFVFSGTALIGMILASLHLGRKERAWLSVRNILESWLSREIAVFLLFAAFTTAYLSLFPERNAAGWLAVILGFAALFTIDRVYKTAMRKGAPGFHSADLVLTGVFFSGLLLHSPALALLSGLVKLLLYARRKFTLLKTGRSLRPMASGIRILSGFLLPLLLWSEDFANLDFCIMAAALAGEIIDRCEYYVELETDKPARQLTIDLENRIKLKHL